MRAQPTWQPVPPLKGRVVIRPRAKIASTGRFHEAAIKTAIASTGQGRAGVTGAQPGATPTVSDGRRALVWERRPALKA